VAPGLHAAIAKQDGRFLPGHVGRYNGTPLRRDEGGDGAIPRGAVDPHPKPPPGARRGHEGIVRHRHGADPRHGPPPFGGDDGRRGRRGEHTPLAHCGRAVDPAGRRGGDGGRREGDAPDIPFFLVHINKTGGTSPIRMLDEHCSPAEYATEEWTTAAGLKHRSSHSTARSYIARHGRRAWDRAYTFAVVRHPLARQVPNFFFLAANCAEAPDPARPGAGGLGGGEDRRVPPPNGGPVRVAPAGRARAPHAGE